MFQDTFWCRRLRPSCQLCRSLFSRRCLIRRRWQQMMVWCCDVWHSTLVWSTSSLHVCRCLDTMHHASPSPAFIRRSALLVLLFFVLPLLLVTKNNSYTYFSIFFGVYSLCSAALHRLFCSWDGFFIQLFFFAGDFCTHTLTVLVLW